jgi:elongation factor Ts
MEISAKEVMALREKTGAGMMDCKKALAESNGDVDKAVNILREKGLAKAAKRIDREAQEGIVSAYLAPDRKMGVVLEVNSETDFVSRTEDFIKYSKDLLDAVVKNKPAVDAWKELTMEGGKAGEVLENLSAKIGEKLQMRRFRIFETSGSFVETYIHGGGRLGVMLEYTVEGSAENGHKVAHDLAMQIAAAKPIAVDRTQVTQDTIAAELEIYKQQAKNEGKPEAMLEKIALGKLNKFYCEACLIDQPFIKEPKISVKDFLNAQAKEMGAKVEPVRFIRFALGGN